jgi:hypothetical protein
MELVNKTLEVDLKKTGVCTTTPCHCAMGDSLQLPKNHQHPPHHHHPPPHYHPPP